MEVSSIVITEPEGTTVTVAPPLLLSRITAAALVVVMVMVLGATMPRAETDVAWLAEIVIVSPCKVNRS